MTSTTLPESQHVTLYELAESVWAAIVKPPGPAAGNSGILDLGRPLHQLIVETRSS